MSKLTEVNEAISKQKLIPLFYTGDQQKAIAVTGLLYDEGIRVIEFTNRGPEALPVFAALAEMKKVRWPGLQLLTGTIFTPEQARAFLEAGADGLISPCYDTHIAAYVNTVGASWIPGCMTPSEINQALRAGCNTIKLFPGNTLGTGFLKAIRPVFPDAQFMITGGVELTEENIKSWFAAGASALGLGGNWIAAEALQGNDFTEIKRKTLQGIAILEKLKLR